MFRSRPVAFAFTLTEILVALGILVVLTAIILPIVLRSKESAVQTGETNALRQIYLAVNLYEADYDHAAAPSLDHLTQTYIKPSFLENSRDERRALLQADWPANPWVNIKAYDTPYYYAQRSRARIAYFYLKPFEGRFPAGRTFDEYRNTPTVGMIAGFGLMKCDGPCSYWSNDPPASSGHPATNLYGAVGTIRMDGSAFYRHRPQGCAPGTFGHGTLFLGGTLACPKQAVTPV